MTTFRSLTSFLFSMFLLLEYVVRARSLTLPSPIIAAALSVGLCRLSAVELFAFHSIILFFRLLVKNRRGPRWSFPPPCLCFFLFYPLMDFRLRPCVFAGSMLYVFLTGNRRIGRCCFFFFELLRYVVFFQFLPEILSLFPLFVPG